MPLKTRELFKNKEERNKKLHRWLLLLMLGSNMYITWSSRFELWSFDHHCHKYNTLRHSSLVFTIFMVILINRSFQWIILNNENTYSWITEKISLRRRWWNRGEIEHKQLHQNSTTANRSLLWSNFYTGSMQEGGLLTGSSLAKTTESSFQKSLHLLFKEVSHTFPLQCMRTDQPAHRGLVFNHLIVFSLLFPGWEPCSTSPFSIGSTTNCPTEHWLKLLLLQGDFSLSASQHHEGWPEICFK